MSDPFKHAIGGGLKLKGALAPAGGVKKKKSSHKDKDKDKSGSALALASALDAAAASGGAGAGRDDDDAACGAAPPAARTGPDRRTDAEKRYDERIAAEEKRIIAKMAAKTHREKVQEFNLYLSKLSEHHDIPRVGPG
jgi:protein FAM32A